MGEVQMNAEARRSMRLKILCEYFERKYYETGGTDPTYKGRRAYEATLAKAKGWGLSSHTADDYLEQVIERLRKK